MRPLLPEPSASVFPLFFVQVFMLLFLFAALLNNVGELTLFCLTVILMSLGAYFWSRVSLNRVECRVTLERRRLFPGGTLRIGIRAVNAKLLPMLFRIDLFIPQSIAGTDGDRWISEETGLLWFQRADFVTEWRPERRGVYDLGPLSLRGGDLGARRIGGLAILSIPPTCSVSLSFGLEWLSRPAPHGLTSSEAR